MDSADDKTKAQPGPGASPHSASVGFTRRGLPKTSLVAFALIVVAAGAFGLYEIARPSGKPVARTGACAQSLNLAQAADPLAHGEVAALMLASKPNPLGTIAFDDANGMKTTVGAFEGKTILLNLWATWCVPCRLEMPALNKLQADLGSKTFQVVPVNVDTARLDKPKTMLKEIGAGLPYYADNSADILQELKKTQRLDGLPTSILIGGDGCEIGTMSGPAVWDSPDARSLIEVLAKGRAA